MCCHVKRVCEEASYCSWPMRSSLLALFALHTSECVHMCETWRETFRCRRFFLQLTSACATMVCSSGTSSSVCCMPHIAHTAHTNVLYNVCVQCVLYASYSTLEKVLSATAVHVVCEHCSLHLVQQVRCTCGLPSTGHSPFWGWGTSTAHT